MKSVEKNFYLIYFVFGFIFLKSSWGKIEGGQFVSGLGGTLEKFASKNPYPWFKEFLTGVAIPNSQLFGNMTMWGEFLTGLGFAVGSLYLLISKKPSQLGYVVFTLGCLGGFLLNGTFWLAAGWTSASTDTVNLVMMLVGLIGLVYGLKKSFLGSKG